jgi:hypothetical protein
MADEFQQARWSRIIPLLREFETYLAPDAPPLEIINANDWEWSDEEYRHRKREFKICSGSGVYLLFNANEQLRYIGVAMNTFDHRIWGHDEYVNRRWTDVIRFHSGWCFLAPALEFFLIVKLQPRTIRHTLATRLASARLLAWELVPFSEPERGQRTASFAPLFWLSFEG